MIRRVNSTPARAGMTLIELLVVMMIIATLASLILSAVFTVRESQMKSFTESLVQKLSSAITQQWQAAIDQIREEPVPNWALQMASNDARKAKVIYLKARLKQEFPVSFYEAMYPYANYTPGQTGVPLVAGFPAKQAYVSALNFMPVVMPTNQPIPQPADWESSALLYLALSQGRRGQTGFNPDEIVEATAIQTRVAGGVTFKIFVDSWGNPIRFWAFPYGNDELNGPPYLNSFTQNQQSPDPQDPDRALLGFTSAPFTKMVHPVGNVLRQLIPVVGSIGKDGQPGVDLFDMSNPTASVFANDNIYSYRLRRFGQRGD